MCGAKWRIIIGCPAVHPPPARHTHISISMTQVGGTKKTMKELAIKTKKKRGEMGPSFLFYSPSFQMLKKVRIEPYEQFRDKRISESKDAVAIQFEAECVE